MRAEEKEDCMEKRYVLGADLGTTSVKVGLFDDQGAKVAACTREHQLIKMCIRDRLCPIPVLWASV